MYQDVTSINFKKVDVVHIPDLKSWLHIRNDEWKKLGFLTSSVSEGSWADSTTLKQIQFFK